MNIFIQNNNDGTISYFFYIGNMKVYVSKETYLKWIGRRI